MSKEKIKMDFSKIDVEKLNIEVEEEEGGKLKINFDESGFPEEMRKEFVRISQSEKKKLEEVYADFFSYCLKGLEKYTKEDFENIVDKSKNET